MQSIAAVTHTPAVHCQECHSAIPAKRLNAIPDARFCVPCQEYADVKIDVFKGMSRLQGVLAVGAVFHSDDLNEIRTGRR